jgi:hypothetical protein
MFPRLFGGETTSVAAVQCKPMQAGKLTWFQLAPPSGHRFDLQVRGSRAGFPANEISDKVSGVRGLHSDSDVW